MAKRFVTLYTIRGKILNFNQSNFYVELLDNDQHWFDDRVDDLLGSAWTDDSGSFEISFEDDLFRDNWFEGKPELFVVIRDNLGKILHKSSTKNPSGPEDTENLTFDVELVEDNIPNNSPYDAVNTARFAAFNRVGDTLDLTDNVINSSRLLMQSLNAWLLYTNEVKWNIIGYDGPQVERYPWRNPDHDHKLAWDRS